MFTVVCKYFLPFGDVGCTGTSVPISWVKVLEVVLTNSMLYHLSDKLAAQVLVCLPIGWVEVLEVLRLKCWKFCWESCANTLYASTIFPCSLGCPGTCVPAYRLG